MVMKDLASLSAYHGAAWQPRPLLHTQEIEAGSLWEPWGVNTEWMPLERVVLFVPPANTIPPADPDMVQHIERIDYPRLSQQMEGLAAAYEKLGVNVTLIEQLPPRNPPLISDAGYNLMYARDLFWMTPFGAVISRMASMVRAGEERHITATIAKNGVPIAYTIGHDGLFEGADALWLRPDLVLIGIGRRTNQQGFQQIAELLKPYAIRCVAVPVPSTIQHLLGILQIVDQNLIVGRRQHLSNEFRQWCLAEDIQLIEVDEHPEITHGQALNFVTVAPRCVMMLEGRPETQALLQQHTIDVCAVVSVPELLKGGGGIGCATGIAKRALGNL